MTDQGHSDQRCDDERANNRSNDRPQGHGPGGQGRPSGSRQAGRRERWGARQLMVQRGILSGQPAPDQLFETVVNAHSSTSG